VAPGTPPELPPDEEIIRRLRSNDEGALELLVAAYWHRLVRFVGGFLDQEGSGEDVVQEAFIRLWMRRAELRFEGSFRAFLYTMARNAAIDERRRSGRRARLASRADPPAASPSPLAHAEAAELRAVAEAAVTALPPRRREVFRLARTEGLSYREIADVMGLSPQTVANQMSRALTELHHALDRNSLHGSADATPPASPPTRAEESAAEPMVSEGDPDRVSHEGGATE
jgi:RNA polymerase sigma-70 factor (ECF subfamily)